MCKCTQAHSAAERILRATRDPYFPEHEFSSMKDVMLSSWRSAIAAATHKALSHASSRHGDPTQAEADHLVSILHKSLSGIRFIHSDVHSVKNAVVMSYHRAKREVDQEKARQTKSAIIEKDGFNVEVVDGMSEFEAINAITEQLFIAAGDFWDAQMQESIKKEIESFIEAGSTRTEFVTKLRELINERLVSDARDTLADSYFENLAHHIIVRTRTIGKFARGKQLGAKGFKPINPLDRRTSQICRIIVASGVVFPPDALQPAVNDILTARSTAELKVKRPFVRNVEEARQVASGAVISLPPYTWGSCRTTLVSVF